MFLFQLPEDVLYLILSYLDYKSLCRLSQVCKRLCHFTARDVVWRRIAKDLINTGMTREGADVCPAIPLKDRVKTSQNWKKGDCRKDILLKWKINLLPWIQLDSDVLYLSQAADIGAYHLPAERGKFQYNRIAVYSGHQEDVCRFTLTDTHLISAGGDGKIIVHHRESGYSLGYYGHNQEVNCIDCKGGLIVSGSRDKTARIWSLSSNRLGECLHTVPTYDRVWSVAISPSVGTFVTGTACCENFAPLRIWDTERCQLVSCLGTDFRRGAGVLDIVYESPFQLLTCGYDTYIRYWDLRVCSRKCVMEWEEPHDSALYCIKTDGNHMIASGSSYYGVVRLWDKRQTRCLQMFQLTSATSSPVYSLCFNTTHLYAALAAALYCLDFKTPGSRPRR
ncbi:LOW QUALITY PROTEIN: F-box/WD repeat-containing protein 4 [Chanos chanos]|uniref:LOW QUALITY PROTEIN: F-box/WD repeat-containing protein 4 n=1 Tax=Chanos chanos TaxID=29144 RepID=A0A6J2V6K5_CHACN|nr:LOW QUALITY PROTEIN: F-box/WD repeat-containing protein 4 [Chanos chanos]